MGDFFQLPPVRDRFVFQNGRGYVQGSNHLWRELFTLVELTANMHQRNDSAYSEVLNRVRTGSQTAEDIQLLRGRLTSGISNPVQLSDPKLRNAFICYQERSKLMSTILSVCWS